ncbi:MAG: NFACT family protein [Fimbriimonadaceae bacterium]
MPLKRIPFDSGVLAAVVAELQPWVGAKIQNVWQIDDLTITLELFHGSISYLSISADPTFHRVHLTATKGRNQAVTTPFLAACRSNLDSTRITSLEQIDGDRVLDIVAGPVLLRAELMGKHSNLILVDREGKIVDAAKRVGPSKSSRVILPGKPFSPPPIEPGLSRFAKDVGDSELGPVYVPGYGAYPRSVAALGYAELRRESLNVALDQFFAAEIPRQQIESRRASLLGQLSRLLKGREAAIREISIAVENGDRASENQLRGELLLAYGAQISPGTTQFATLGYSGEPITIEVDPEKTAVENATTYFERAKKAKKRLPILRTQLELMQEQCTDIGGSIQKLESAETVAQIQEIFERAQAKKWLHKANLGSVEKDERPFEGNRIREYSAPHGYRVLVGENSTANDYLTLRVAKPDDFWLHARGQPSAHAIIPTARHPEKVQPEVIAFAARLVVQHSPMKHSTHVPVDYCLRKHVRKPRGSKMGAVTYSHEKTVVVN